MSNNYRNALSLIPFLVFIGIYLGSGMTLESMGVKQAFYQFPAPLAAVMGIMVAFIIIKGKFKDKFDSFISGCGDSNVIIMCMIYLLAGGFATVCKDMGSITSVVNLGLAYVPVHYLAVGIFIISSFISTATGTSVGCIAAVTPLAVPIALQTGISLPLVLGSIMGGAMLGDNLSIISDTTIASTSTQGCNMRDKFRVNFILTLIPAIITIILLLIFGSSQEGTTTIETCTNCDYNIIKVLPYIVVIISAIMGMNVFMVLTLGIVLAGAIGLFYGDLTLLGLFKSIYKGFTGMTEIFILSMLTGGLAEMVKRAGGISYLLNTVQRFIKGKKSAELGIATLVSITDIALANNTIAILINGDIAKNICYKFKVDPRRSAALLDIFSAIFQGLVPYGAQMLILTSLANKQVSPIDVLPYTWYIYLLAISAIVSIFIPFSNGFINKNPWNFEKRKPQRSK